MEAEHTALLYYCETRWLSRANMLGSVFELKEVAIFLNDSNNCGDASLCSGEDLIKNDLLDRHI
jgi:hypothetical protein